MSLAGFAVQPAIAVSDLTRSREFYEQKLGLPEPEIEPGGVRYFCGAGTSLFVYESQDTAGSAEHTIGGWYVNDLPDLVQQLKGNGVQFAHYESGTPTDEHGIFTTDRFRAAWILDPDGNTVAIQEYFTKPEWDLSGRLVAAPIVHVEVRGRDPQRLKDFYRAFSRWTLRDDVPGAAVVPEVSDPGQYSFVERAAAPDGSGVPAGIGGGPSHDPYAIFYIGVTDVAAALDVLEAEGGRRVTGPKRAPDRNLAVALARDPEGSLFGLAGPALAAST